MDFILTAGVDEAGRGPLVGSVFAAAVILPEYYDLPDFQTAFISTLIS